MKAIILAGGKGTRISEESHIRPKPMVEIGGKPILWHILKLYSSAGINQFIICCGYKSYMIKEYFANYSLHNSDVTFNFKENSTKVHQNKSEPWEITLVDTGEDTMTGGRLKRLKYYLKNEDTFCFTYGDGLADIDLKKLIKFHNSHGKMATLTAVNPPARFGAIQLEEDNVKKFVEKPIGQLGLVNGGFFVLSNKVLDFIDGDSTIWEEEPLKNLSKQGELKAFYHDGFWQPMDTLRDKMHLQKLWDNGIAPWKNWETQKN